jgi:hypothetical protein
MFVTYPIKPIFDMCMKKFSDRKWNFHTLDFNHHYQLPINVPAARSQPSLWITHKENGA